MKSCKVLRNIAGNSRPMSAMALLPELLDQRECLAVLACFLAEVHFSVCEFGPLATLLIGICTGKAY
uniref:Uncharacterized protein n=1 Tax=Anguilla anguilla TaxID=7936 RepID=A0A0E9RQG0_ANGAN